MRERVLRSISRYSMLPSPDLRVIAAVSGGPDSVCLLHVLREIGVNVVGVVHFNHELRGEASEEDQRFVDAMAQGMGLDCWCGKSRAGAGNLEENLRHARRDFFLKLLRGNKCERVALGHTRNDQAETVLFRILRGSGLTGIGGIPPATAEGFIRPLIEVTRADVENYLRERNIPWREDASNTDRRFARNRIRHDLLPQLAREWNPKISEALAQLGDLAREEDGLAAELSRPGFHSAVREFADGVEIDRSVLDALPRAMSRRVVRRAIKVVKGDLRRVEFDHVERIVEGGVAAIPGIRMEESFHNLRLERAGQPQAPIKSINVKVPGTYGMFGDPIRLEIGDSRSLSCVNLKAELAVSGMPLILRSWKAGDHYRAAGASRDRKLKEMFQIARIPSWQRRRWPILEQGGKILWAREFGAAEEFVAGVGPVLQIWDMATL